MLFILMFIFDDCYHSHTFPKTLNSYMQLVGAPLQEVMKHIAHWHCGYDKTGRPVLYKQYSQLDATALKRIVPYERFLNYHMWEQVIVIVMHGIYANDFECMSSYNTP